MAARDQCPGFRDDGAEFVATQGIPVGSGWREPQQVQHAVRHPVDGEHQRLKDDEQPGEDVCGGKRDTFGVKCRERLWGYFGEDQDDQGEKACRQGDAGLAEQAQRQYRREGRCGDVHEVVPEEDQADESVRTLQKSARAPRAPMSGPGEMTQPVAVQGHHARLGAGETCREDDEDDEGADQDSQRNIAQTRNSLA